MTTYALDPNDRNVPRVSAWSRLPRGVRLTLAVGTVVGLLLGLRWYLYPANQVRRALAGVDMPAGITADGGEITDNGWLCWDACSSGSRYYASSLPPEEAAREVEKAMLDQGWASPDGLPPGMQPCVVYDSGSAQCTMAGPGERDRGREAFAMHVEKGAMHGWVAVGVRADGRYGAELVLIGDGIG